ncbi:MAG: hypothetical protein NVS4B2_26390 [Chloroflexota bacterium]
MSNKSSHRTTAESLPVIAGGDERPAGSPDPDAPCGETDPYARQLSPDDLSTYLSMTADADLSREIRLLRTVLASLSANLDKNHQAMARAAQTLLRAIYLHARQSGNDSQLQIVLDEAGEYVIDEARGE